MNLWWSATENSVAIILPVQKYSKYPQQLNWNESEHRYSVTVFPWFKTDPGYVMDCLTEVSSHNSRGN